jgi:hypothetical protein
VGCFVLCVRTNVGETRIGTIIVISHPSPPPPPQPQLNRPTYVPNSVFVDTMVTNMDRITHRRFEASFSLRYQDFETLPEVILEIKKALRVLPKVDVLSPFRVHFTTFGPYCLNLQASCYFATKSLDEFLYRECSPFLSFPFLSFG